MFEYLLLKALVKLKCFKTISTFFEGWLIKECANEKQCLSKDNVYELTLWLKHFHGASARTQSTSTSLQLHALDCVLDIMLKYFLKYMYFPLCLNDNDYISLSILFLSSSRTSISWFDMNPVWGAWHNHYQLKNALMLKHNVNMIINSY